MATITTCLIEKERGGERLEALAQRNKKGRITTM
jgi:hypothetical protein